MVTGQRGTLGSLGVKGAASCWPWVFLRNMSDSDVVDHERRAIASESDRGRR